MEDQLLRIVKKQLFWNRLLTILVLLLLIILVFIAVWAYPLLTDLKAQVDVMMADVQTVVADLDEVAKSLQEVDFSEIADNINGMVRQSGEAVTEAMEQMDQALQSVEELDIEGLNAGISRFNSVVEPLAKLFGK